MRGAKLTAGIAAALLLGACDTQVRVTEELDSETAAQPATLAEIEAVMADSAAGWNEGDMDRFLAIYAEESEATFVGSAGLSRGKDEMEQRYRAAYDWSNPEPDERGTLTFETQDFRPLGDDHALYIGRYILTYPDDRDPATGLTSLVFAREAGGWRIIADHSS